jgi:GT2 family glycosyltransferase
MKLLEILIPSVPEREEQLASLAAGLMIQIKNHPISISTYVTQSIKNGGLHTGLKRQNLIESANSEYVVFIDDDDIISNDYISEIFNALKHKPDVVTFNGWMTTNGGERKEWEIKLGNKYSTVNDIYYRPPNHLSPIKTEIALAIGYPSHLSETEDFDYCMRLQQSNLIQTSVHIDKKLYHYDFKTTNKLY